MSTHNLILPSSCLHLNNPSCGLPIRRHPPNTSDNLSSSTVPPTFFLLQTRTNLIIPNTMAEYILNATISSQAIHPFYPLEANIVGYLANQWSVAKLLGIFAGGLLVILGATLALVRSHNPDLHSRDTATILWFVLSKHAESHKPRTFFNSSLLMLRCLSWDYPLLFRG